MNVSGIFKILIIVVACIIVGGVLLNILLPNTMNGVIRWMENGVMAATGAQIDLDGDGNIGTNYATAGNGNEGLQGGGNVDGYNNGGFSN